MGKRGPAPKPSHLKKIQGTYRPDRAAPNEPTPEPSAPSCPSWLGREAKREWRRIVPELEKLGLISEVDRAALAAYCSAYGEWHAAEAEIKKHGRTQINMMSGLVSARPEVAMRAKALAEMRALLAEFGMTPSSRSRISVPEKPDEGRNDFLDALRRGKAG